MFCLCFIFCLFCCCCLNSCVSAKNNNRGVAMAHLLTFGGCQSAFLLTLKKSMTFLSRKFNVNWTDTSSFTIISIFPKFFYRNLKILSNWYKIIYLRSCKRFHCLCRFIRDSLSRSLKGIFEIIWAQRPSSQSRA